jgi:hypothetical protein
MSILTTREKRILTDRYGRSEDREVEVDVLSPVRVAIAGLVGFVILCSLTIGGCAVSKDYSRYQKRQDAVNETRITAQKIKTAQQQARIVAAQDATVRAQADQRLIKARGIKAAQDEIQATLTPLYVQFEAIEAQKAIATSGRNNTVIYVPAGTNGTPTITANASRGK